MNAKSMMATAKSKTVVQDATLRGIGTTLIGLGVLGYQGGVTLEEKALGLLAIVLGVGIYIIKDVIKTENDSVNSTTESDLKYT